MGRHDLHEVEIDTVRPADLRNPRQLPRRKLESEIGATERLAMPMSLAIKAAIIRNSGSPTQGWSANP
jgi:hypothetical protein